MKQIFDKRAAAIAVLLCLCAASCGRKEYYVRPTVGAAGTHGTVTGMQKIEYTPEQMAKRDKAYGYAPPRPDDARLAAIEEMWPRLTEAQRAELVETAKKMTGAE